MRYAEKSFAKQSPKLIKYYSKDNKMPVDKIGSNSKCEVKWKCDKCGTESIEKVYNITNHGFKCSICDTYSIENEADIKQATRYKSRLYKWFCPDCQQFYTMSFKNRVKSDFECPNCKALRERREFFNTLGNRGINIYDFVYQHKNINKIKRSTLNDKFIVDWVCHRCNEPYQLAFDVQMRRLKKSPDKTMFCCDKCRKIMYREENQMKLNTVDETVNVLSESQRAVIEERRHKAGFESKKPIVNDIKTTTVEVTEEKTMNETPILVPITQEDSIDDLTRQAIELTEKRIALSRKKVVELETKMVEAERFIKEAKEQIKALNEDIDLYSMVLENDKQKMGIKEAKIG